MEKISEAIEDVLAFLENVPLDRLTVNSYRRSCQSIYIFCKNGDMETFDDNDAERFINNQRILHEKGEFGSNKFNKLQKSAVLLVDHMQGRGLVWGRRSYRKKMNGCFEEVLSAYAERLEQALALSTCKGMSVIARQFLVFLEDGGKQDIKDVMADDVKDFMSYIAQKYANSMRHIVDGLKRFLSFLNSAGLSGIDARRHLAMPAPRHKKLYPCFTDSEIEAIFAAVERSTPLGKRDYAILKIALGTGLRVTDILGMKRTDIDWVRNEISLLQSKTDTYAQLPLRPDVGNAIAEYIMDARPKSDSPYIFLRNRMPHSRLFASGSDIANRYLKKAGIKHDAWDGKSFHAFRRTAGTRLVRADVPLTTVAQMMIHGDIDSTKRYISLDNENLRVCCLDISGLETTKGGLS